ncbi:Pyrophosphate-energized proton pump, partial [hydrothermal vent metagenome]
MELMLVIGAGFLAIIYGVVQTMSLLKASPGNEKMQEIAKAIQEGANAYLKRQYMTIAAVGVVVFILLFAVLGPLVAVGFAVGAFLSGLAGFVGMLISVRANVRTAEAASKSLAGGLSIAFRS